MWVRWRGNMYVSTHPTIHQHLAWYISQYMLCSVIYSIVQHISKFIVYIQSQFQGHETHLVTQGPTLRRAPHLAQCSIVTILKFLIFYRGVLHFHFALSLVFNYVISIDNAMYILLTLPTPNSFWHVSSIFKNKCLQGSHCDSTG